MKTCVFVSFLFLLVVGCVSTKTHTLREKQREFEINLLKTMKTWEGHHISQLVQRLGPATYKVSDEAGGTIYIWKVDPNSLPYLSSPQYIEPPEIQSSPRSINQALSQSTSKMLYHQRVAKQRQHYYEMNSVRQRILAMKRMFYVHPDGTIYLARLMFH